MRIIAVTKGTLTRADTTSLESLTNLEEYDAVILDLNSIVPSEITGLYNEMQRFNEYIHNLLRTERSVYCIMAPIIDTYGNKVFSNAGDTNYNWLKQIGVELRLRYESGTSIEHYDEKFEKYFEEVDQWNFEIKAEFIENNKSTPHLIPEPMFIHSLAYNKSMANLAIHIARVSHIPEKKGDVMEVLGSIYLLPPPTRCSINEAIEILLDIILKDEIAKYDWWHQVEVPGTKDLQNQIKDINDKIFGFNKEKISVTKKLEELLRYRDLLSADGASLVDIVKKALQDIGISTEKTQLGEHVDLIGSNIAIEVTGTTDKIDLGNKKITQLMAYRQSSDKKIVLIANTYKRESPNMRKDKLHFTPEALTVIKSLKICAMTTHNFYEVWRESKRNPKKIDDFRKSIYETEGELKL